MKTLCGIITGLMAVFVILNIVLILIGPNPILAAVAAIVCGGVGILYYGSWRDQ